MDQELIDCSIIVPVFNNEGSLRRLYESIKIEVIKFNIQKNIETIFIDDGSSDKSIEILLSIKETYKNHRILIVQLTRNFGQQNAILAGLKNARGKCFVNLSADMQEPVSLINEMINYHFNEDYEIVVGTRAARKESYYRKITSNMFYSLMRKLAFPQMPKGGFDFMLFGVKTREFIINNFDANPFFQGMLLWTGYKMKLVPYTRMQRESGKSMWTFSKKLKTLIDGVLSYTYFPIRLISFLGILIALFGFLYAILIVFKRVFDNVPFKGWAAIMILILVLSGIQMLMLGIIGEYLWRTFDQVRLKQPYLIEKIYH